MKFSRQTTLRALATVTGVGVHSGTPVSLTLGPAPADAGYIFVRTGLEGSEKLLDYSATKGAIHAFTKSLAKSLIERGNAPPVRLSARW